MTALHQAIVTAYEVCGLTPSEIALQEDLEVEAVKSVLLQFSAKFRKEGEQPSFQQQSNGLVESVDPEPEITSDEYRAMWAAYKEIALYSEVDSVRERALRFALEEKKGRNKARVKALQDNAVKGNNILVLNQILKRVKLLQNGDDLSQSPSNGNGDSRGEALELPKIIDVECEKTS